MRIVPFSELRPSYGISLSLRHLRRLIDSGQFPRPVRLSPRRIGWTDQAIEQWIAARQGDKPVKGGPLGPAVRSFPAGPAVRQPPPKIDDIVRGFAPAKERTARQRERNRKYSGPKATFYAGQLCELLTQDMYPKTPRFAEAIDRLCGLWIATREALPQRRAPRRRLLKD